MCYWLLGMHIMHLLKIFNIASLAPWQLHNNPERYGQNQLLLNHRKHNIQWKVWMYGISHKIWTSPAFCWLYKISFMCGFTLCRADSMFAPSQWEKSLQSNAVSHWLCANWESALLCIHSYSPGLLYWHWYDCFISVKYRHTSKIRHTLVGNETVDH